MKNLYRTDPVCTFSYFFKSVSSALRAAALTVTALVACGGVQATEPYLGELRAFAFDFCPQGWVAADGSTLPVRPNPALFSLVNTTFGGDGLVNFGLPDLRGRTPLGSGFDNLGNNYQRGQKVGQETVTLSVAQMPAHVHGQIATTALATHAMPTANALLAQAQNAGLYVDSAAANTTLATTAAGNGVPVPTRDPYLAITWCMAKSGIFPTPP